MRGRGDCRGFVISGYSDIGSWVRLFRRGSPGNSSEKEPGKRGVGRGSHKAGRLALGIAVGNWSWRRAYLRQSLEHPVQGDAGLGVSRKYAQIAASCVRRRRMFCACRSTRQESIWARGVHARQWKVLLQLVALGFLNWSGHWGAEAGRIGECERHSDCGDQFCRASVCRKDGLDLPCTQCEECLACTPFVSVDSSCPQHCPIPMNQLESLQGLFTQLDEDGCVSIWLFEHDNFRRFDSGVLYAHALGFPDIEQAQSLCSRTGGESRIVSGHFELTGYAMKVWLPNDSLMSSYEITSAVLSLIPWGVRLTWADGSVDELIQYSKSSGGVVLPTAHWTGTLSMFQTNCNVSLQMFPVGEPGKGPAVPGIDGGTLWFWKAVTWNCDIGPRLAPGMQAEGRRRRPTSPMSRGLQSSNRLYNLGPHNVSFIEDRGTVYMRLLELNDSSRESEWCLGGCTYHAACWLAEVSTETLSALSAQNQTFPGPKLVTSCECSDSFHKIDQLDEFRRPICADNDECLEGTNNCAELCEFGMTNCSICENTVGSFVCSCNPVPASLFCVWLASRCDGLDVLLFLHYPPPPPSPPPPPPPSPPSSPRQRHVNKIDRLVPCKCGV